MKLLFRASKRGGTNTTNPEYVKINKTVIVIGEIVSEIFGMKKGGYMGIGFNDDNELSLFYSQSPVNGLFRITNRRNAPEQLILNISKANEDTVLPYVGTYKICKSLTNKDYNVLTLTKV